MQERTGRCACGGVRYRLTAEPMIVHACHCSWCQRETGGPFAVNAVVETSAIVMETGGTSAITTPSASGRGQVIHRCPDCHVALWSHYSGAGPAIAFLRAMTLDPPGGPAPDVHIFTETKAPWLALPAGARVFAEYYHPKEVWTPEARARWTAARA